MYMRSPNARMQKDVASVQDPHSIFSVAILESTTSKDMADHLEKCICLNATLLVHKGTTHYTGLA